MDSSYMDAHDDPGTENAEEEVGYPFTFQALSRGLSADFRNHLLLLEENEPLYLVHALLGLELGTITREEAKVAMLLAAFEWEKIQHEKNGGDRKTDFADALLSHSAFKVHDVLSSTGLKGQVLSPLKAGASPAKRHPRGNGSEASRLGPSSPHTSSRLLSRQLAVQGEVQVAEVAGQRGCWAPLGTPGLRERRARQRTMGPPNQPDRLIQERAPFESTGKTTDTRWPHIRGQVATFATATTIAVPRKNGNPLFGFLPRGMRLDPEKWNALDDRGREVAARNVEGQLHGPHDRPARGRTRPATRPASTGGPIPRELTIRSLGRCSSVEDAEEVLQKLAELAAGQRKLIESEAKRFKRYHIAEAGELPKDHVAERNTITSPATLHVEGSEYKTVGSARHPPVFGGAGAAQQRRLRLTAASLTTVDAMSAAFAPELPKKEQNCAKKLAELMFKKDRLARDLLPDHPTQTLSGKMEKRLQYWFVGQTKATLEKALLEHALVPEFLTCAFTPTRARPPHLEYALRLKAVHTEDLRRLTANKPPVSYLRKKFVKEPIPAKLKRAILDYASVPEVLQNMSFLLSNETNDQITQMLDEISTEEVTLGDTLHAACVTYFRKSPVFSTLITLADQKIVAEGTMLQGTVRVVLDNVRDELLTNDNVFKKAFLAGLFAVLAGTPLMVISRDRGGVTVSIMEYRLSLTTVKDAFIMAWTMQQAALARRREMSREKVQNKPGPKGLAAFEAMLEQAEKFCDVQGVLFFTVDREREALGAVRGQMLEDFARRWKDRMPGTPLILSVAETAKMQTAVKLTSRQNQVQILRKRKLEYTPPREATAMCSYYLRQLLLKSIALDANIWHVPIIDAGAKDATGPVTHFQSTADRVIHEAWRLEQEQLARQQQPQKGKGGKGAKGSKQGKAGKSVPPSGSSSTARVEALKGVVAALAEFSATGFLRGVDTKRLADLAIRPSVESVIAVCQSAGLRGPSVQDASIESGDRARGMCDAHPLDNPLDKTAWMPPMIFAFLSDGELLHVSRVCRHWLQIGNEVGFDRLVQAFYPYAEGLQNLAKKGFVARMGNKACMLALSEAHGNEDTAVKLLTKKYKSYPKASPDRI
eukprot:gene15909-24319_t